jgi:hypothetical protein
MKKVVYAIVIIMAVSLLALLLFALDDWLGIAAFTLPFLVTSGLLATLVGVIWRVSVWRNTHVATFCAFAILSLPWTLPPSSARLLRLALIRVPREAGPDSIRSTVREVYRDSGYTLPHISVEPSGDFERVHVSLISQEAGNCTSIHFLVKGGVVVHRFFSPD